jgi:hypothetical protein
MATIYIQPIGGTSCMFVLEGDELAKFQADYADYNKSGLPIVGRYTGHELGMIGNAPRDIKFVDVAMIL